MKTIDVKRLRSLATSFHDAMERTDFSDTGLNLKNFPRECCHHASKLLGIFLEVLSNVVF